MTRLFFDIDGVLAEFREAGDFSELLQQGYFLHLKPQEEPLKALWALAADPDFEVHTLSAVIKESPYALAEKQAWLDEFIPDTVKRQFCWCGEDKSLAVPGGIQPGDILIDDYNFNLRLWKEKGIAVKLLNGINDRHGSWDGPRAKNDAEHITRTIRALAAAN
jgi:5'(3')-deoxyribonucleotidase